MSATTTARRMAAAAAVLAMIGAGCGSPEEQGADTARNPAPTSATTSADAAPLAGFVEPVDGTEGTVTYQAELPQLRGGDAEVRDRFNAAMRAALDDHLKPADDDAPMTIAPGVLPEDERSAVSHIGTRAVAGVLVLNIYVDRAAHPFNTVSTTVIDTATAAPIMITDLFADDAAGFSALVDGINAEIAEDEKLAGQSAPAPVADQLAAWVPDDDGLVVYISVAHVLGDYYPITVDWDVLDPVLAPGMREMLTA
ncbi:hypothetical protein [[Mycobacterium] wendilense]|uniref:DUF3298 domain-containing protein n=1 Tax=[Mycobacterium] wendilense TaxID=3064284 RepID=A0ABN9P522_9MYCO|nr:hypothetical protein [Mycolicibacterium sp. MU0050]CAJ1584573.1 hypothetical protein MU0050_003259 [Mycolicibacterium sp. MU0050]